MSDLTTSNIVTAPKIAVTAGWGLTGGGDTGDVALAINTIAVQSRVAGCPMGSLIRAVYEDGTVDCQVDDVSPGDIADITAGVGIISDRVAERNVVGRCEYDTAYRNVSTQRRCSIAGAKGNGA